MKSTVRILVPATLAFAAFAAHAGLVESHYSLQPRVAAAAQSQDTTPRDNAPSLAPPAVAGQLAQYQDSAPKDNAPSAAPAEVAGQLAQYQDTTPKDNAPNAAPAAPRGSLA